MRRRNVISDAIGIRTAPVSKMQDNCRSLASPGLPQVIIKGQHSAAQVHKDWPPCGVGVRCMIIKRDNGGCSFLAACSAPLTRRHDAYLSWLWGLSIIVSRKSRSRALRNIIDSSNFVGYIL
jgi:hypothetical protein